MDRGSRSLLRIRTKTTCKGPAISVGDDLITKGEIGLLKETMALGHQESMQTFDQHIYDLYREGRITYENAYTDSPNDLRIRIKVSGAKKGEQPKPLKLRMDER